MNIPQTIFYCTASVCLFFLAAVGAGLLAQIRMELTETRRVLERIATANENASDSHFRFVEMIAMQGAKQ